MTTTERIKQALARIFRGIDRRVDDLDLLAVLYVSSVLSLVLWGAFK